jgi:sugar lactone lactonase YvrE
MFKLTPSTLTRSLVLAAMLTVPFAGTAPAQAAGPAAAPGITFVADQAYPEGVAWSAAQKVFFVSSIHKGIIGKVTLQGVYTPFIQDDKLVSSVGLHFDAKRKLLWVAIGDLGASTRSSPATQGKLAALAAYDAITGERRAYHDLGSLVEGGHFANDIAIDAAGNVYVTDSFAPVIYRVDATGHASVFARSELFAGEGFNLNGIVAHPDGYLLVAKSNSGEIFRISTSHPADIQRVSLTEAVKGADGLILRGTGRLTVVQNSGTDQVVDLVSQDGWKSAARQPARKSAQSFPTTGVLAGKHLYVLNSRLDTLFSKDAPKVGDYLLQRY